MDDEGLSADPARVAAFRTGVSAETQASAYLMLKGYRIVARRYRSGYGEIDIVARRRQTLVFVEVKTRARLDDGLCGNATAAAANSGCDPDVARSAYRP
jgi:putative endonuclease